jgi:hypothetical protein
MVPLELQIFVENLFEAWIVEEAWMQGEHSEVGKLICLRVIIIEWCGLGTMEVRVKDW